MASDPPVTIREDHPMEANQAERERWNDSFWAEHWPKREQFTTLITPDLLETMQLKPGERVLDIGCGGGLTTIAAARQVGSEGAVVGADISAPLAALASRRAEEAGVKNVAFKVVDAQTDRIEGGPFDAAMSQFGVMFFDEPVTAFRNVRAHLAPTGRLGFACWQPIEKNPWFYAAALKGIVPPPPPPEPGKSPTGPFVLGDEDYVRGILENAGFAKVSVVRHGREIEAPMDALFDDAQLTFMGVPAERMAEARNAVNTYLAQFRLPSGLYRFPLAFQIVSAAKEAG
jgi:SAM-dependent methyltransferase